MADIDTKRREFIKGTAAVTLGAALATKTPSVAHAQTATTDFDINAQFAELMRGVGGTPADAGGTVTFTGRDPILRSHFRIASSMAIPAMAAGVGAAAIWKERTGEGQDLRVDLRESVYNLNPVITVIMQLRMKLGRLPADDAVARNFTFVPTVNGNWYQ